MSGIICPIRGGPHSQPTIQQAIDKAKRHQIPVYFLYVVNLDFLDYTEQSRSQMIQQEMRAMGEFICLKAQIEAERKGVQATAVVREGSVGEEIIALSREVEADYVMIGRPQHEYAANAFNPKLLEKLRQRLQAETGAEVIYSQG